MDFSNAKKRKVEENGDADSPPPQSRDEATVSAAATLSAEDIRKILQPLSSDQLVDLLQSASLRHPDVLDAVRAVADRDSTSRKLFVRGLAGETTTETLRRVFSAYGDLDEAIVIFDKATGRSKGYGFVVFRHVDGAILALKDPSKKIDGRMTVTQLAAAGGPGGSGDVSLRKVFVGNVPFELSSERLLDEFLKFGEVEEGPLGFDKSSGKTKGFAFFVYKTEEGARASLVEPLKTIDGHQVICKLAVDNKKAKPFGGDQHQHQQQQQNQHQHQQQQVPQVQQQGPVVQYGGYGVNGYGMQHSVAPYNNQAPVGGYGHVGAAYGNAQMGGPVSSGDYGGRVPPNSAGGFPDGSQYGFPPPSALQPQQQQIMPMARPPPTGMYQQPYY